MRGGPEERAEKPSNKRGQPSQAAGEEESNDDAPIVDFHNHVIPGVDDGARDPDEGLAALELFRLQGVGVVVATPHLDASLTERPTLLDGRLAAFDEGFARLEDALHGSDIDLLLRRGVELKLDAPEPDISDPRVRLAGTRFVLVEFVGFRLPPYGARQLSILRDDGWIPIVAHPERYVGGGTSIEHLGEWREAGAYLQVNSGSLVGQYGSQIQKVARAIVERGWADYLSSDHHARGEPYVTAARRYLLEAGGPDSAEDVVRLLTETNPARMLKGEPPHPVPPFEVQRKRWRGLRQLLG